MGRRGLQLLLGVLATVAVASGLFGMIFGPEFLPDGGHVSATIDSEYRFVNAFWFTAGAVVMWSLPRVERATAVLRLTLGAAFLGGVARLWAAAASGWPNPVFVAALGIELLLVPVTLCWQARVTTASGASSDQDSP
ncbi:hypothetical protein Airi01_072970 [Actinoallomurus iriomotensis]|uniref:DUF4345 domain-containing protein n=2 Tax=Actinoallomurus iriomotensis TaxID=478107 RepID=A0A9W6RSC3_9ACTN|nr:hypothetical protein Airi01_072970 [Actinoallomurus iriomotensis]